MVCPCVVIAVAHFYPRWAVPTGEDEMEPGVHQDWQCEAHLLQFWRQGCRRQCAECITLAKIPAHAKLLQCEQCQQHFESGSIGGGEVCKACSNWRLQAEHWCEKCRKTIHGPKFTSFITSILTKLQYGPVAWGALSAMGVLQK